MLILCLDCSTDYASVAITDRTTIYERSWHAGRRHTRDIAPVIRDAQAATGYAATQFDAVAVGLGPGSYTGIRVGLALAKGFALAVDRPLVGFSTLEALAFGCGGWNGEILALIPLNPDRIGLAAFSGPWRHWRRVSDDTAVQRHAVVECIRPGSLVCGPGADAVSDFAGIDRAPPHLDAPQARHLGALAAEYFLHGGHDQVHTAQPHYLRASSAEERRLEAGAEGKR